MAKLGFWFALLFACQAWAKHCPHLVVDIAAGAGDPVIAAASGDTIYVSGDSFFHPDHQLFPGLRWMSERFGGEPRTPEKLAVRPLGKRFFSFEVDPSGGRWITPWGASLSLLLPGETTPTAASFSQFRPTSPNVVSHVEFELFEPFHLAVASWNKVFLYYVRPYDFDQIPAEMRDGLADGLVRITRGGQRFDFVDDKTVVFAGQPKGATYLVGSEQGRLAFEILPPLGVFESKENLGLDSIDFVRLLDGNFLLMGSEKTGRIVIYDIVEQTPVYRLRFAKKVWLSSVTGYRLGEDFEVWAVDGSSGKIFHWQSDETQNYLPNIIPPFAIDFPDGHRPVQIGAYGRKAPPYVAAPEIDGSAPVSNFFSHEFQDVETRVVVLSDKGEFFALRDGRYGLSEETPHWEWIGFIPETDDGN